MAARGRARGASRVAAPLKQASFSPGLAGGWNGPHGVVLKGNLLQEKSCPVPEVVRLAQVLEDGGFDGDGGSAPGQGLQEGVQGRGVTVPLHHMGTWKK